MSLAAVVKAAIDKLAREDEVVFTTPNDSATDVQRQVTGRAVDFDTLHQIYQVYLDQFWGHRQDRVAENQLKAMMKARIIPGNLPMKEEN